MKTIETIFDTIARNAEKLGKEDLITLAQLLDGIGSQLMEMYNVLEEKDNDQPNRD